MLSWRNLCGVRPEVEGRRRRLNTWKFRHPTPSFLVGYFSEFSSTFLSPCLAQIRTYIHIYTYSLIYGHIQAPERETEKSEQLFCMPSSDKITESASGPSHSIISSGCRKETFSVTVPPFPPFPGGKLLQGVKISPKYIQGDYPYRQVFISACMLYLPENSFF